nr:MAG TPA: hypothetical protein [Caudoviricetes sp.]
MDEREKLIELLSTKIHPREGIDPAAVVADFLLDHDVLPVVRCGDCAKRGTGSCPMEQDYPWISSDSDGFCHHGERKEAP